MRKNVLILPILCCLLCSCGLIKAIAQNYDPAPVTVSTDRVTLNGKDYLYHSVQEKQTLYSIAKAYGVTVDEIYDANPTLKRTGLLKDTVILIPVNAAEEAEEEPAGGNAPQVQPQPGTYKEHIVKWYETIEDIADMYGISVEELMQFNNLESRKLYRRQVLLIPIKEGSGTTTVVSDGQEGEPEEEEDTTYVGKSTVNLALILPFNPEGRVSTMNMDFYAGVLLALRNLQKEGISTHLNAYDLKAGVPSAAQLEQNDFILGPVAPDELTAIAGLVPGTTVISPLDQKAISLCDTFPNFIQAPTYVDNQYKELVQWLKEERKGEECVILLSEKGGSDILNALSGALAEKGIRYETLIYNTNEGSKIPSRLASMMHKGKVNHAIVASENEAFVADALRNLSIMDSRGYKVVSYGTSKLRLMDSVDNNFYHQTSMHLTTAYYVDYGNADVNSFVLAFRALYNTEPSQFAFQGYDTAYFFIKMCSKYGDKWLRFFDREMVQMLHLDFQFNKNENGSYSNGAIRRVIYNPDMKVVLVR